MTSSLGCYCAESSSGYLQWTAANPVSAEDEHMRNELGVPGTYCNWSITEKGWRPVALSPDAVTHAGGGPRVGAGRHLPLPPASSIAPWHV